MEKKTTTIDISIITYNSARWLPSFFSSLEKQQYPTTCIRLLIRDNGSTDTTWEWFQTELPRLKTLFSEVICEHGDNIGFGSGHNQNFTHTKSKFVLVTNVDLCFEANTLVQLLATAQSSADQVACWECRQKPYEHPKNYHPATLATTWCSSACALFRVDALKQVGGYEERLFLYGEDVELSYRLRDHDWTLQYTPKATVWHYTYEHAGQVKKAQFLGSTLANALIRCRYGNTLELLAAPFFLLALLLYPPQFQGQRWAVLCNLFKFFKLAPAFLSSRKRSNHIFPFRRWDYELARDGAFYTFTDSPLPDHPLVSVLVRTMPGCGARLREAVNSVLNQTYPNIELVVVEDGGNTANDFLESVRNQGQLTAVVFKSLPKQGRCQAGNAALAASAGDMLCFLDDDDLLYADHLEVLVQSLLDKPVAGGVYGLAFQVSTQVLSKENWNYIEKLHQVIHRQPFERAVLWHHNFMPIQSILFRRALYLEYGGFDTELDNLEDWNLWVRYTQSKPFCMVEKVTSLYRVPSETEPNQARQKNLDDYYQAAAKKNDLIHIQVKPSEIVILANALNHPQTPIPAAKPRWRHRIMAWPVVRWQAPLLVKLVLKWRSMRIK